MAQKSDSRASGNVQARPERQGWRDEAISRRHRLYGFDCPAVDIDFLMIEYDRGKPVALIEYKHYHALGPGYEVIPRVLLHPSYKALQSLAGASKIPFLIAYYHPVHWSFKVLPGNGRACIWFSFSARNRWTTERDFVYTLYAMRGHEPDLEMLAELGEEVPS